MLPSDIRCVLLLNSMQFVNTNLDVFADVTSDGRVNQLLRSNDDYRATPHPCPMTALLPRRKTRKKAKMLPSKISTRSKTFSVIMPTPDVKA